MTTSNSPIKFTVSAPRRFFLFLCITALCAIIATVIITLVTSTPTTPRLRIATVIQDVIMFILPAVATSMLITRRPADFMCIGGKPGLLNSVLVVLIVFASYPAMNLIIEFNESLTLPEQFAGLESWMKQAEMHAAEYTDTLIGGTGLKSFIAALLIVGIFAAVCEEIFFRGVLQRLVSTAGVNAHLSVWLTAFIFSAVHMQFYGFIPRLLLGAFFGYLLVWTGNLWYPVLAHFTNNALAALGMTIFKEGAVADVINQTKLDLSEKEMIIAGYSAMVVALLIIILRKVLSKKRLS